MKAYKGTDKDLKCRGFQYKFGKIYKRKGSIELCEKGFHACENPFDVFCYYSPDGQNRFFEVEQDGEIKKGDDKTVSSQISIATELSFRDMLNIGFKLVFEKVKRTIKASKQTTNTAGNEAHANTAGDYAHANTAGDDAHANTAGDYAHANTAGNDAHANTAGDYAHANTAGDDAHANTAGYRAHANTAGNRAHANTAGNDAHANTAGDYAHANTAGDEAIACALGMQSRAKAVKGWIIIVDWQYVDGDGWKIKNIHCAKVGNKVKGVKIEPDTWYWFEDGKLKKERGMGND